MKLFLLLVLVVIHETSAQTWCSSRCICIEETANCSRQGLIYIPKIPKQITRAIFSYNRLKRYSLEQAKLFTYNTLEILNLKGNQISRFPFGDLEGMTSLKILNLGENQLETVSPMHHTALTELWLQKNQIKEIEESTFVGLVNLRKLILSYNKIQTIGGTSPFPSSLIELNLNRNSIMKIGSSAFENLKQLSKLSMLRLPPAFNKSDLEPLFEKTPSLTWLKLSGAENGQFTTDKIFSKLRKLEKLTLRYLNIKTTPDFIFLGLNRLQEIDLSGNNITKFDLFGLGRLKRVDLSYNRIEKISSDDFFSSYDMEYLNLSHNSIRKIQTLSFTWLNKLKTVDLSFNELTTLDPTLFSDSGSKLRLNLHHNPWQCSCNFVRNFYLPLLKMENVQLACKSQTACLECAEPEHHMGLTLGLNATHNSMFSNGDVDACNPTEPTTKTNQSNFIWIVMIIISCTFLIIIIVIGLSCYRRRRKMILEAQVHLECMDQPDLVVGHEYTYIQAGSSTDAFGWGDGVENPYTEMVDPSMKVKVQGSSKPPPRHSTVTKQMSQESMIGGNDSLRKYVCMRSYASQGSTSTTTTSIPTSSLADDQEVKFFASYGNVTFNGQSSCKDVYLAPAFQSSTSSNPTEEEKTGDDNFGVYVDLK